MAATFHDSQETQRSLWQRLLAVVASLGLLASFVYAATYFSTTAPRMESHPLVVNLAKRRLEARIGFGRSPSCGDGQADCWALPEFDDSAWGTASLPLDPSQNITSLSGYETGLKSGSMYYRFTVDIPAALADLKEEISFAPLWIQHQSYRIFLNGRLVFTGNGIGLGQFANIPIPKEDIKEQKAHFAIRASVAPTDIGIASHAAILLGPKSVLDSVYIYSEQTNFTYPILFMLSKGSIFVIFALFLVYTKAQRGLFNFLIFAFCVTTENLYVGDYLAEHLALRVRVVLFYGSKAVAVAALVGFFLDFFHVVRHRRLYWLSATFMISIVVAMTADFGWGTKTVTYTSLWGITNIYLVSSIVLGLVLGVSTIARWRRAGADPERIRAFFGFVVFLAVYLALVVWEFYFNTFLGFDKRAVFDLFFFYYLALVTAKDFGLKEGQIVSLEGHMAEKRRMEEDLREAAEIAKALIPAAPPQWPAYALDCFHRPLTEASGDWFGFEAARHRRLFHFVMCDITGHGVQAAIVASTCKATLTSLVRSSPELLEREDFVIHYMHSLNATLWTNGEGRHVSTLLGATLDADKCELHYVTAGHPAPLLLRQNEPMRPVPLLSRNQLLGLEPDYDARMKTVEFGPGDQLIAYTDGLPITANGRALERFLRAQSLADGNGAHRSEALFDALREGARNRGARNVEDDVSVVWFRAVA